MERLPREITKIIVTLSINSGESYRNVFIVCKEWYSMIDHITAENKYTNHLTMLLKLYPEQKWDYYGLSRNPNITWEHVIQNPTMSWDYYGLSCNPNITWEHVRDNPTLPWDYHRLSVNKFNRHKR